MKRLLQLSLLINAVLLGVAWWRPHREAPMPRPVRGEMDASAPGSFRRVMRPGRTAAIPATPWAGIESKDPRQLIANLRAVGCPESTIRDLVVSRVCRGYRNRLLAAEAEAARSWDFTRYQYRQEWRGHRKLQFRLRDEMMKELESLLGQPWRRLYTALLSWPERGDTEILQLEQRWQVREIQQRYRDPIQDLKDRRFTGDLDAQDQARLKELQQQEESEIAALLSPQQREERFYRGSEAAQYVRQHLPQAKSEAEFRQIVRLAAEFDLTDPPASIALRSRQPGAEEEPAAKEYQERRAAFDARLKELLGEERIAEQQADEKARADQEKQREQERADQQARKLAEAVAVDVGVAAADANRFMDRMRELQPTLQKKFDELEKTLTGTPEERRNQMVAAVKTELEQMAVEIMGEKGREFIRKLEKKERGGP